MSFKKKNQNTRWLKLITKNIILTQNTENDSVINLFTSVSEMALNCFTELKHLIVS